LARQRSREQKREVLSILQSDDFEKRLEALLERPARQVINPLFSFLLSNDEPTKWRAVTAMGAVVARLADENMESARVIVRRLMWSLNDESGGIGWGAPEAIGEIIARHQGMAEEYAKVLISYIWEEGNYLEYPLLQRGALWGVGRAAQGWPHLMKDAIPCLTPFLDAPDAVLRGLAAWALGLCGPDAARSHLEPLLKDTTEISLYLNGKLHRRLVKNLAAEALAHCR
jgi:HEAT repeat protein